MGCISSSPEVEPPSPSPSESLHSAFQPSTSSGALQTLDLYLSPRFNMIDVFVRPAANCERFPPLSHYEIQYRKRGETAWTTCPKDKLQVPEGVSGRFYTIAELDPQTEFEVRCKVVTSKGPIVAESLTGNVTTSTRMAIIRSYVAKFEYKKRNMGEIATRVGDILQEDMNSARPQLKDFIYVHSVRTNQAGYVPLVTLQRFLAGDVKPCLIIDQECFFNINRRKAEVWMMRPNVEAGRFIVRPSHSTSFMAITVRFGLTNDGVPHVEHFKIFLLSDGYGCYVNVPTRTFEDIAKLIEYYKGHSIFAGSNLCLTAPFPRNPQPPTRVDEIKIPTAKIELLEQLGKGHFGEVHKARLNNLLVAVKMLRPLENFMEASLGHLSNKEEFLREAKEMAEYFHDNLVRLIGVCVDAEPYLMVSELMNRGSLQKWLHDDTVAAEIQLQMIVFILGQVACGMNYLAGKNVVHRDVRAANVLVHDENDQLEIKITDFGLTRRIRENEEIYRSIKATSLVPIKWTAPEAYTKAEFSSKSDVWSFGILAYEVFTLGKTPFKGKTNEETCAFVKVGGRITIQDCRDIRKMAIPRRRPSEDLCPDLLFFEIDKCWKPDPHNRPTFEALYHFLDNYETESMYN